VDRVRGRPGIRAAAELINGESGLAVGPSEGLYGGLRRAHAHDSNAERDYAPLAGGLQDQFTRLASRTLRSALAPVFAAVTLFSCF